MSEKIQVFGARVHNLKNIDVEIPRHSLTVITGLSGSGKSSLAFDTIFAEGQRRYIETFSAYARNFLGGMERPDVDKITGLSPVISIEQKTTNKNPRSTVGTTTEVYDYMRLLFARAGRAYSYATGEPMVKYTEEKVVDMIQRDYAGKKIFILAPLVRSRKGHYRELFEAMRRKGYLTMRVDGEVVEIARGMKWKYKEVQSCIHNYVDFGGNTPILRKGAVSAMKDQKVIIPINMKEGILLGKGLGSTDWNCSAPHGSGRVMKREDVRKAFTVSDFKAQMKGIYSSCIGKDTLDEAPFAYRSMEEIREAIGLTVRIDRVIRPVYSFKAGYR